MRRAQIIQIVLLLVAIFIVGVITGRLSAPRPPTLVLGPSGQFMTSDIILGRLSRQLSLDTNQQVQFRVLLEEMAVQIARHPPASQERYDIFRNSIPLQKALLRPDQYEAFDRVTRQTERRFQQMMRQKAHATNTSAGL